MTIYQEYHKRITARNDSSAELCNPRQTFNWGYWDAEDDIKNNRPQRTNEGQYRLPDYDPYYTAAYNWRWGEYKNMDIVTVTSSESAWNAFIYTLPNEDYMMTVENILESITRGREYLFSKKQSRAKFDKRICGEIVKRLLEYAEPKNSKRRLDVYNTLCNWMLVKRDPRHNFVTQEYLDALYSSLKA